MRRSLHIAKLVALNLAIGAAVVALGHAISYFIG